MQRRIVRALVLSAGICLSTTVSAIADDKVSIRTDWVASGVHAPLHLALVKGWFKEAGLDVDLQDGKGSTNTTQLVATGVVDIGEVTLGDLPIAQESGMRVKAIAGFARRTALAVLVPNDSPVKTAQNLRGETILLFAASTWTPFVDPFFKAAGMTRNDVHMVFVDPGAFLPTYASGKADAFMSLAPAAAHVTKTRPSRAILAADYGITFPDHGLIASEETIKNRPDLVRRVVSVAIRAWKYVLAGHESEAVDAVIRNRPNLKLDRDDLMEHLKLYEAFVDTNNTVGKPFGWQSPVDWQLAEKTLVDAGVIKPGRGINDFFTNEFVEGAKP
jgi:NitT/TauT family transport system substrate-binding protein